MSKKLDRQGDGSLARTLQDDFRAGGTRPGAFMPTGRKPNLKGLGLENTRSTLDGQAFLSNRQPGLNETPGSQRLCALAM